MPSYKGSYAVFTGINILGKFGILFINLGFRSIILMMGEGGYKLVKKEEVSQFCRMNN